MLLTIYTNETIVEEPTDILFEIDLDVFYVAVSAIQLNFHYLV